MQNRAFTTPAPAAEGERAEAIPPQDSQGGRRKRISMHEGVAVWCDCCSCAAEPYWLEVAEELGIDQDSDYVQEEDGSG